MWPSLLRVQNIEYRGLSDNPTDNPFYLPHELARMVVNASTNICDATI